MGGSDPTKLFGRLKAEKVGSLPPVLVVSWPLLCGVAELHLARFDRPASQAREDLGAGEVEERISCTRHR